MRSRSPVHGVALDIWITEALMLLLGRTYDETSFEVDGAVHFMLVFVRVMITAHRSHLESAVNGYEKR